jgi:rhodanese-related sulfurtransferase
MATVPTEPRHRQASFSFVEEYPAAEPAVARAHFLARLSVETDPADVRLDLDRAPERLYVIDARSADAYAACHVPGAINLPHRTIDTRAVADLDAGRVLVVYCWGPGCNAAQKAAARLAGLGFRVKEMIGGLEYWRREGYEVAGAQGDEAPLYG